MVNRKGVAMRSVDRKKVFTDAALRALQDKLSAELRQVMPDFVMCQLHLVDSLTLQAKVTIEEGSRIYYSIKISEPI